MKVVHIESGLGNQMLSYCEYLVLKKMHPNESIFIETTVFDIDETNEVINQWNGYELNRIFGIKAPNIKSIFSEDKWQQIMNDIVASKWWEKNWNYPVYIVKALNNAGLDIKNIRGDFELPGAPRNVNMKEIHMPTIKERVIDTEVGEFLNRYLHRFLKIYFYKKHDSKELVFYNKNDSIFTGQWLSLKQINGGIDYIEEEVDKAFRFPDLVDTRDMELVDLLRNSESVAIHARRGDMLGCNGYCYKYGYFKRAVKYIRKRVNNPVFVFFCDPESSEWCKSNYSIFGLDSCRDSIFYVDWNKGTNSYRDMQLMSYCKHAIITNSSFGWWGAYFIKNPIKITISPWQEITMDTKVHC